MSALNMDVILNILELPEGDKMAPIIFLRLEVLAIVLYRLKHFVFSAKFASGSILSLPD